MIIHPVCCLLNTFLQSCASDYAAEFGGILYIIIPSHSTLGILYSSVVSS